MPLMERLKAFVKKNKLLFKLALLINAVHCKRNMAAFRAYISKLSDQVEAPVFVKVGAHDGKTGDPCSDILLSDDKWRGLLIEPMPDCVQALKKNFDDPRFIIESVAIGIQQGTVDFYYVDPEAIKNNPDVPNWSDQLNSFDRNHIVSHLEGKLEPHIKSMEVEVHQLQALIDRHELKTVHLLHIDTEGYDFEVLKTLDFSKCQPYAILLEHVHLKIEDKLKMKQILNAHGYTVKNCGSDYFFQHDALNRQL